MRDGIRGCACVGWLDLGGVDFAYDAPGCAVGEAEDEDAEDDDPAGGAVGVDDVEGVEGAH